MRDAVTFPLTRALSFTAACIVVALIVASMLPRADEKVATLERAGPHEAAVAECHLLERAISRRACRARLERAIYTDIVGAPAP